MIASISELLQEAIKDGNSVQESVDIIREHLDGQPAEFWDDMASGAGVSRRTVQEQTYGALATIATLVTQMEQVRRSQN